MVRLASILNIIIVSRGTVTHGREQQWRRMRRRWTVATEPPRAPLFPRAIARAHSHGRTHYTRDSARLARERTARRRRPESRSPSAADVFVFDFIYYNYLRIFFFCFFFFFFCFRPSSIISPFRRARHRSRRARHSLRGTDRDAPGAHAHLLPGYPRVRHRHRDLLLCVRLQ